MKRMGPRARRRGPKAFMPAFEIAQQTTPRTCVVQLSGDIDTAVVPELKPNWLRSGWRLRERRARFRGGRLRGQFGAWVCSCGLITDSVPSGGRLVLSGANPDVERILELSGLVTSLRRSARAPTLRVALAGLQLTEEPADLLWNERFEMPADVNNLAECASACADSFSRSGSPSPRCSTSRWRLGEALANAIRHGSRRRRQGRCRSSCRRTRTAWFSR